MYKVLQTEEIETLIQGHIYRLLNLISKKEWKWCTEAQRRNDNMSEFASERVVLKNDGVGFMNIQVWKTSTQFSSMNCASSNILRTS